jgi:hypothetical protein
MIGLRLFFNFVDYWSWVHQKSLKNRIGIIFFKRSKGARKNLKKIRIIFETRARNRFELRLFFLNTRVLEKNKNHFMKKGPELGLNPGHMNKDIAFNHCNM